ncbi:hypothetical protein BJ742DRAFT_733843 [Cladochytrium replicatum]|nr:hypothetical protein BJ742DRAFT_733843 [Cladochytrium replicatum]
MSQDPTEFLCYYCRSKMHHENPTKFPNEYEPKDISSLALFRRALCTVWEEGLESVSWLAERLGVDKNKATALLKKLQEERFTRQGKAGDEEEEAERHKDIKFKQCQIRVEKIMSDSAFAEFQQDGNSEKRATRGVAMPTVPQESDNLLPTIGSRVNERLAAGSSANRSAFQTKEQRPSQHNAIFLIGQFAEPSRIEHIALESSQPIDQVYTLNVVVTGGSIEMVENTFQQSAPNESNMEIDLLNRPSNESSWTKYENNSAFTVHVLTRITPTARSELQLGHRI